MALRIEFVGDGRAVVRGWGNLFSAPEVLRAAKDGLREGGDKTRTQVRRAVKDQANFARYATVTSAIDGLPIEDGFAYVLRSRARGVRITDVAGTAAVGSIYSAPWSAGRIFKRSFVNPRNRKFVARLSSARFPIRTLYGPSPAKEMMTGRSVAVWRAAAMLDIPEAISRRMARIVPV